jgi:cytochrome c
MRTSPFLAAIVAILLSASARTIAAAEGDPQAGAQIFGNCAACHSLTAGRHMTGPSLAGVWNRKAGAAPGFARYSDALKNANLTWNAETLDRWLADPPGFIPGNRMTFPGIKDAKARADVIAYLQVASTGQGAAQDGAGGMMGGMMSGDVESLKQLDTRQQVTAIRYCGDTYDVTTADGQTQQFWERNLRFKTDSSDKGPPAGHPALMGAGMMGDRASVIFAAPSEIGAFIEPKCP